MDAKYQDKIWYGSKLNLLERSNYLTKGRIEAMF
jgi:hypothetical protein